MGWVIKYRINGKKCFDARGSPGALVMMMTAFLNFKP